MIRVATLYLCMRDGTGRRVPASCATASPRRRPTPSSTDRSKLVFANHLPSWKPQLELEHRSTVCGAGDHIGLGRRPRADLS
jgi:hypothetical protein